MDYNWTGKTILVAEDDQLNFILLETILESTLATVIWAKNGIDVINQIKNNNIDLLLMDVNMPEMDGFETVNILRTQNINIPIIIQSATSNPEEIGKLLEKGCNEFIKKPIDRKELYEKIEILFCKK